ncbi:hypothetical protein FS749_001637, partial [Ceratobasidium sp. UAMH 11750]
MFPQKTPSDGRVMSSTKGTRLKPRGKHPLVTCTWRTLVESIGADEGEGTGTGAGEGEDDEDAEEDEDEEQIHFAGRMKPTEDTRQHVVYPNPALSIALKPTAGQVRGLDLMTKYGATDSVHALHHYLRRHATRQNLPANFLPTAYHKYPVWHRLYLPIKPFLLIPNGPDAMSSMLVQRMRSKRVSLTSLCSLSVATNSASN